MTKKVLIIIPRKNLEYGGEEFAILLVQTDLEQARNQAERIRQKLEKMKLGTFRVKITTSFGVATLRKGDTMDSMLKRADDALYEAKRAGRNRVKVEE